MLHKLLETDDPVKASHAAYLLAKHGSAGEQRRLEKRLNVWRAQWRDKVPEADATLHGLVERGLVQALISGKSWKLTPERVQELKRSCLTQLCKKSNLIQ